MKFNIITLGCKVNAYESEIIKEKFLLKGYQETDEMEKSDIVIVNSCSVTNMADNKSLKIIRGVKRKNPQAILVVCGCMAQNHQQDLNDLDIDILIGTNNKSNIVSLVEKYLTNQEKYNSFSNMQEVSFEDMEIEKFTSHTRAYLKIQDGCDNYCSYCIIPYLRGKQRSKNFDLALKEARNLVKNKHQEIVLTGIHTGSYKDGNYDLADLIEQLCKIKDLKRIRISSIEILEITPKFLEVLKNNSQVCNHLHIPLQSGSDKVLKLMNRRYNTKTFKNIVAKIRQVRPDINLTTDLIVGFPGESEEDFLESYQFCQEIGFSKIHVFPFSLRSGTKAEQLPNHLDNATKKRRSKKMLELSSKLEEEYYRKFLNKEVEVLIETAKEGISFGHTSNYIPVEVEQDLIPNQFYQVKITDVSKAGVKGLITDCIRSR